MATSDHTQISTTLTDVTSAKQDQQRLKDFCDALHDKGVKFLLSNSATDFIKDLYRGYRIDTLAVPRTINAVASKRGKIDELLIRNYA